MEFLSDCIINLDFDYEWARQQADQEFFDYLEVTEGKKSDDIYAVVVVCHICLFYDPVYDSDFLSRSLLIGQKRYTIFDYYKR